ncbi:imidazoleglycerol-phosphate dehydratase HisB [Lederbergia citrea]|uniref:Imidazoleglycerol-phosphate dehydratase n=1 Tax=Lederbergia citrea TaxID=2833581 RepID=A0A942US16_9BACI|nr:imidazoleglycerol-phosphate dehydratase HisB [Lederbergia citrea]MBS4179302.1 imidazoleglycerol-phosphate dehydratase HisB [Lederbergia citrea]MBS4205969.1 imidazoleglycerol-phosphate dehydratase HisB [Lederbergia citrea]MBS4224582.1 imidazoleglycerol-phosphate dehydratase HisB [Lederbergia citrea]
MRSASNQRETTETKIELEVRLEDPSVVEIATGVGFFDHMLEAFARHGRIGLTLKVDGDLHIDSHHTVEDAGIVLGKAVREALGDKKGIVRYGSSYVPMDETLGFAALDISGRPFLHFEGEFQTQSLGNFDTELVKEFFRAFAFNAGITLHARILYGENTHHKIEALFKALGRALAEAIRIDPNIEGVNSTKGLIE